MSPDYVPSERDLLLSLLPTHSISTITLKKGSAPISVVDVGGRFLQRRKWSLCLQDATSIILCVSLADYDRFMRWKSTGISATTTNAPDTSFINASTNVLHTAGSQLTSIHDALAIAEDFATRTMRNTPMNVIFTKPDILYQKLSTPGGMSTFKSLYADCENGDDPTQQAIEHIKSLFVKATKGAEVRFHVCNVLDQVDVTKAWSEITSTLR